MFLYDVSTNLLFAQSFLITISSLPQWCNYLNNHKTQPTDFMACNIRMSSYSMEDLSCSVVTFMFKKSDFLFSGKQAVRNMWYTACLLTYAVLHFILILPYFMCGCESEDKWLLIIALQFHCSAHFPQRLIMHD